MELLDVKKKKKKKKKKKNTVSGVSWWYLVVLGTQHFQCCSLDSVPGLGTEIPHQAGACYTPPKKYKMKKKKNITGWDSEYVRYCRRKDQ